MPEYVLTARDLEGRKVTERVEAPSADAAVQVLRDRGCTEVVLHTDDVGALYPVEDDVGKPVSPREYLALRMIHGYLGDVVFLARKMYVSGWMLVLVAAVLLGARRMMTRPWSGLDSVLVAFLALPVVLAVVAALLSPVRRYNRLLEHVAWGRWQRVLELLPSLQGKITPDESAFRKAEALAGLGRLDLAMRTVEPFSDGSQIPEWLYWGRLANVYESAGLTDQVVASHRKAAELAPDNATVLLDLALAILRYQRDPRSARALLEQVKTHAISDFAAPFVLMVEGMAALEEGRASGAKLKLEQALAGVRPFVGGCPLLEVFVAEMHAYLAIDAAAHFEWASARRHFRRAERRLRAVHRDDLVRRCEDALKIQAPA